MDDAELVVEIDDGVDELSEDDRCFVLFQEAVLLGVLEEIALRHDLRHQEKTRLGLELP